MRQPRFLLVPRSAGAQQRISSYPRLRCSTANRRSQDCIWGRGSSLMLIDRRTFIQSAACVAALLPLSSRAESQTQPSGGPTSQTAGSTVDRNSIVFKIEGWDLDSERPTENVTLIRINQTWRTAWR